MSYIERLEEASYISPSGIESLFKYESVSREISHRIGSFEFSGVNGTLHQDKGVSGEVYPLIIYFSGPDYDISADLFLQSTKETGKGTLNHPRWGRRKVQLLNSKQNEHLTERGSQAVFNITLQESLDREFPKTGTATQQTLNSYVDEFKGVSAENFSNQINTDSLDDELSLEQDMIVSAGVVETTLSSIASSDPDILTEFTQDINDIINNASAYVDEPLEYANRIVNAILIVADVPGRISSKLQGYTAMVDTITSKVTTGVSIKLKNSILIDELLTTSSIVGSSTSINDGLNNTSKISRNSEGKATISVPDADNGFQTREEVLSSAIFIQNKSDQTIQYLDSGQVTFSDSILSESYIQTVQSYVPTWLIASLIIKAALDLSFSLPSKRTTILQNSRTILDLCYDFYKNVDNVTLDYFILTNSLTGNDIILVPRKTEVIYYE